MSRAGSNDRQREFAKLFMSFSGKHNRHNVWQDFVWMTACAISNTVDNRFAEQREARYREIVRKYTRQEADIFPTLFALIVSGMEEDPDQDFLGELYMTLELGNSHAGQFFTPYDVCSAMSKVTMQENNVRALVAKQGYISVHDPACGAGATLVSAANTLRGMGINYQQCALFIGQDIDYTVGLMCYIQLSMLGCAGYVRIGNTITDPMTGRVLFGNAKDENIWYTPMFFTDRWATLRAIDEAKRLFSAVATGFPQAEQDNPSVNMGTDEEAAETVLEPIPEPAPEEPAVPVITVKKTGRKKQLEGQLMFDF